MTTETTKKKRRISLSTAIIISLVLGVAVGLFFGEYCAKLQPFGDAFIGLLQMTILPYIILSMISGLGGLSFGEAKLLAYRGGGVMVLFWIAGFIIILIMPLTFPPWESASFFSSSVVALPKEVDFVDLYIPANPFRSMAENVIPAVVLFCIAIGVALIGIKEKESLVAPMKVLTTALTRIAGHVVYLTPIGVFAIAASAAGTMTLEEFGRLQVYFIAFIVASLLLTYWILPVLVMAFTPFKYKDIIGICKDAMVTGFTTGNLFIILPLLIENAKQLFINYRIETEDTANYVDVIIPVSFNFPNIGKLLVLLFVLFAGWFSGNPLGLTDLPNFVVTGLFSFFGGVDLALPFLLDVMQIPADLYQLYLVTGIINGRFATLLGAMNLLTFTVAATCAVMGLWKVNWRQIFIYMGVTVGIMAAVLIGTRVYLGATVSNVYTKDEVVANMQLLRSDLLGTVHKEMPDIAPEKTLDRKRLDVILSHGALRIGYLPDALPWSYFNAHGDLVGFDVELAYLLAADMGVHPEFIPVSRITMSDLLADGIVDIIVGGVVMTPERMADARFTDPHLNITLAFVVRDHRRREFSSLAAVRNMKEVRIGLPGGSDYFVEKLQRQLPNATVVKMASDKEFFEDKWRVVDAMLTAAESGSSWTLVYPSYAVVVPKPAIVQQPVGFAVAHDSIDLLVFVNGWLKIKKADHTIARARDYWIMGVGAEDRGPRWSIIRDVLGWID